MSQRSHAREDQLRRAVALEAARIMAEQGISDFLLAKRKAAQRLLINSTTALPKNAEIEAALREHQRLFQAEQHPQHLRELRRTALHAMRLLLEFNPRLVGPVLSGSATQHTEIMLQVFTDQAEQVALKLQEQGIHPEHSQKKLRYEAERQITYPSFKFMADSHTLEIVVLPLLGLRQAPSSPIDGRPMGRADVQQVRELLKEISPPERGY